MFMGLVFQGDRDVSRYVGGYIQRNIERVTS